MGRGATDNGLILNVSKCLSTGSKAASTKFLLSRTKVHTCMHNIERTQEYALSDTYVSSAGYNEILYVTPVVATRTRTVWYCRALLLLSREESATTTTSEDMIISSFFQCVVSLSLSMVFAAKRFPPMASVWVKYKCWSSFVAPVCVKLSLLFFRNVGVFCWNDRSVVPCGCPGIWHNFFNAIFPVLGCFKRVKEHSWDRTRRYLHPSRDWQNGLDYKTSNGWQFATLRRWRKQ